MEEENINQEQLVVNQVRDQGNQTISLKKRGYLFLIVSLILVSFLIGGAYYLGMNNTKQTPTSFSSFNQSTPQPTVNQLPQGSKILIQEGNGPSGNSTFSILDLETKQKSLIIPSDLSPNNQQEPSFVISPDKRYVGVMTSTSTSKTQESDLYIFSLIDHSSKKLASNLNPPPFDIVFTNGMTVYSGLTWSPDSHKIVFLSGVTRKPELWMVDIDGNNLKRITNDGTFKVNLQWSPDGTKILYRSLANNNLTGTVYLYDVNTGNNTQLNVSSNSFLQKLLKDDNDYRIPYIWIDSDTLLITVPSFSVNQKADLQGLWLLTVSTVQTKRIVSKPLSPNDQLYISPDKKQVVFVRNEEKTGAIGMTYNSWLSNLDGTGLTDLGVRINSVSWSPDSNSFVYATTPNNNMIGLWIYNIATKNTNKILGLDGMKSTYLSNITWSPDSKRLLLQEIVVTGEGSNGPSISQEENDKQGVWLVNNDGTNLQKITDFGNTLITPLLWY
ncbi:hypothetical protein COT44_00060 [Candidatus Shapirobacteria bacterium CG08_land_8_20_14_0_20_39_18]|uniref:Dipeptidylpeptidase IV N-terminal domain-containing protein n=1 Tax=Candidatus Shapirobacteria bacterium CG08_land_8_20_14_0_20_39_18 TaxID=1974883 RepID=A0A2M6XED1_9BACT|nr:MAG: hypothetical protein COT44_00060 [Candidatus Shapirobacteria bacterium CG08_land_8_20_14_0_20_39_18]PIY66095.1 MAG: hypothetical protein COY91_01330 [Candidatus Shapirobacteria bacterium CG_4_10_14_0_8_um_filter_39_15]PJE68650.1 MAG: hypothetical protein COU94_00885 [Candidatus Shapirobacteria bacterium CG10_big_fil_rev_8_21_14_0_10_38_8]